jgi:hypothetical protein
MPDHSEEEEWDFPSAKEERAARKREEANDAANLVGEWTGGTDKTGSFFFARTVESRILASRTRLSPRSWCFFRPCHSQVSRASVKEEIVRACNLHRRPRRRRGLLTHPIES